MTCRKFALITALVAFAPAVMSSQAPDQPPPPFRAGVEVVSVDVSVLDGQGRPVANLAPRDFVVTVAGRPRRVVTASFVQAPTAASGAGAAPGGSDLPISSNDVTALGRLFVFVVDQSTLQHSELRHVADAAGGFLSRLAPADRSALVLMPVGTGLPFTADHASVHRALQHATGLAMVTLEPRNLGLDEVRAIASGDYMALADAAARECPGGRSGLSASGGSPSDAGSSDGGGQGGNDAPGTAGSGSRSTGASVSAFGTNDSCTRQIQFEARSAWQQLHSTTLSSLAALRAVLQRLKRYPGEKAVFLISGGWPLETREGMSELRPVAAVAAEAHVTLYSLFAPADEGSADRRTITTTPLADMTVRRWPLETLATMTGGGSYRVDVGAEGTFARLSRELSGFYRLGIEQDASDRNDDARPMNVNVGRSGVNVRAPQRFTARTYAERDLSARLEDALASPIPATGIGIRLTTYVEADPEQLSHVRIMLAGDATRMQRGDVTFQVVLDDAHGKPVAGGKQSLGEAAGEEFPFATSLSVEPGLYTIRAAIMDAAGTVGSVHHPVDARRISIGPLTAGGIMLVRVPKQPGDETRLILDNVRQDEKLAMQLDLEGDPDQVSTASVVFEVRQSPSTPPLITTEATRMSGGGPALAQAVTDVRLLPAGRYIARARVTSHDGVVAEVDRPFVVVGVPGATAIETRRPEPASNEGAGAGARRDIPRLSTGVRPFAVEQVLAPQMLGPFLDQVAARPDAASDPVRPLIDQARTKPARDIDVPDAVASKAPAVASFLDGVSRLARAELAPAAEAFRAALRASADFYPAMVYLGACYAAGGKDQEAAGAWQTALIREGDVPALHLLLIDAFQRMGKNDGALAAIERARRRWPDDPAFARRFVIVALANGRSVEALEVLDRLEGSADDESALVLGLHALYEAGVASRPIETQEADRARMNRYAELYRRLNGPSTALVEAWLAAANRQP
jgi:VWFA-related protein